MEGAIPSPTLRRKPGIPALPSPRLESNSPRPAPRPNAFALKHDADKMQSDAPQSHAKSLEQLQAERDRLNELIAEANRGNSNRKQKQDRIHPQLTPLSADRGQPTLQVSLEKQQNHPRNPLYRQDGLVTPTPQRPPTLTRTPTAIKWDDSSKGSNKSAHNEVRRSDEKVPASPKKRFLARIGLGSGTSKTNNLLGSSPDPPDQDNVTAGKKSKGPFPPKPIKVAGSQSLNDRHKTKNFSKIAREDSSIGALDLAQVTTPGHSRNFVPPSPYDDPKLQPVMFINRLDREPDVTPFEPCNNSAQTRYNSGGQHYTSDEAPPTPPSKTKVHQTKGKHGHSPSLDSALYSIYGSRPRLSKEPLADSARTKAVPGSHQTPAAVKQDLPIQSHYGSIHDGHAPAGHETTTEGPGAGTENPQKGHGRHSGYPYTPSIYQNALTPDFEDQRKFYPSPLNLQGQSTQLPPRSSSRTGQAPPSSYSTKPGPVSFILDSPSQPTEGTPTPVGRYDPFDAFGKESPAVSTPQATQINAITSVLERILETHQSQLATYITDLFGDSRKQIKDSGTRSISADSTIIEMLDGIYSKELPNIAQSLRGVHSSLDALFQQNQGFGKEISRIKAKLPASPQATRRHSPKKNSQESTFAERHHLQKINESPSPSKSTEPHSTSLSLHQTQPVPGRHRRQRDQSSAHEEANDDSKPGKIYQLHQPDAQKLSEQNNSGIDYHLQNPTSKAPTDVTLASNQMAHAPQLTATSVMTGATKTPVHIPIEVAKAGVRSRSFKRYFSDLGKQVGEPDIRQHPAYRNDHLNQ